MKGEFYKMDYEAWDEGTDALSLELEAAYLRLCHQLYRRKAAIPSAPATLARIWRCHPNKARKLLGDLLAAGKVAEIDGHLTNTRVTRELDDRETMRRQKADAGKTGGTRAQENRRNVLENNDPDQASASPPDKQNQAEREVEVEVEKKENSEPKGSSGSRRRKKPKGGLCPVSFTPAESHYAKAERLGRPRDFADAICRRMIHWSHENANREVASKADWSLALHGFMDREHEKLGSPQTDKPRNGADFWAADAIEGNSELQGGHDDHGSHDNCRNWDRAGRQADGRPYRDAPQSAGNDPRQLPPLRLVGGL